MGTRGLIVVKHKCKYPVAQYCQFDMYPDGHGVEILSFLKKLNKDKLWSCFKTQLDKIVDVTGNISDNHSSMEIDFYYKNRPQLARNFSSKVLPFILNNTQHEIELENDFNFGYDSLFCEWCYVIDLDTKTFNVYSGHGDPHKRLPIDELFYSYDPIMYLDKMYYGVKLVKSYSLYGLPKTNRFKHEAST